MWGSLISISLTKEEKVLMPTFKIVKKSGKEDVITGKCMREDREYYVIDDEVDDTIYSVHKDFCECVVPVSI